MPMLKVNLVSTTQESSAVPLVTNLSKKANVLPELLLEALIENASVEDWGQAARIASELSERFKADSKLKLIRGMIALEPHNFKPDQWSQLEQQYIHKTAI